MSCGLNLWADLNEIIFYSCFLPQFVQKQGLNMHNNYNICLHNKAAYHKHILWGYTLLKYILTYLGQNHLQVNSKNKSLLKLS